MNETCDTRTIQTQAFGERQGPAEGYRRQRPRLEGGCGFRTLKGSTGRCGRHWGLRLAAAALALTMVRQMAYAGPEANGTLFAPVKALDTALIGTMRSGDGASFIARYQALAPVIERVFDLDAVLAVSVGLAWPSIPETQKAALAAAFRRYTVASYVNSFNSYNGQSFAILPQTRTVGNGEVLVQTQIVRRGKPPINLDYVMRNDAAGWHVVDVLSDGTISRVAVQRSDFSQLLASGGVTALTAGLEHKFDNLSGDGED